MRTITTALTLAVYVFCGCGGQQESQREHAHEEAVREPETPEAHADLLRIDPEMLRDLRVTTSSVESRGVPLCPGVGSGHGDDQSSAGLR